MNFYYIFFYFVPGILCGLAIANIWWDMWYIKAIIAFMRYSEKNDHESFTQFADIFLGRHKKKNKDVK